MNELQIFKNEEFGQIRTVEINNQIWFVGRDIATALGYADARKAVTSHTDEDDRTNHPITDSLGRNQDTTIINESGLYSLVLSSGLPNAKKFKKWITGEVIPSIRKNGGYIANQENMTPAEIVANALIVANNIIAERDKQIEEMQPKADYFDALVERNLLTNFRDTAKEFKLPERSFIGFLIENKFVYRDQNKKLKPFADKVEKGLFEIKEFNSRYSDHSGLQTLITPKGRETFRLLLQDDCIF